MSGNRDANARLTPEIAYIHAIRSAGNRLMTAAEAHQVKPTDDAVCAELEAALDAFDEISRSEIDASIDDLLGNRFAGISKA